jgi:hypothetical protein
MKTSDVRLFKPRDGYRTRVAPAILGPTIDYYLAPSAGTTARIEVLDSAGSVVSTYTSDAPASAGGGRRGRAGGAGGEPADPDAAPSGGGRGRGGFIPRATHGQGMNRFVWDVRNQAGITMPPGTYQARLTVGGVTQTQPLTVLIDPNVAADGVTTADLKEQYDHNMRMRRLVTDASQTVARVREMRTSMGTGGDASKLKAIDAIAGKLLTEPVRYGKPGLQAQITYLAGMTTGADQKIGLDAVERYAVLRKELDAIRAELDALR